MTQKGFEDFVYSVFSSKTGTAKSYITAIRIIDEMFMYDDVFKLKGQSISCIDDAVLLKRIASFVCTQQTQFINGNDSIFRNIKSTQVSYPGKRFCSAAIKQLIEYFKYDVQEQQADSILAKLKKGTTGTAISRELISIFAVDKEGKDKATATRTRIGQGYFRKMVLTNYGSKCCVTGLNVAQTLRASHIVAWAEDKRHRMDPENGLCLSATYDAAFDKHLISFDKDYRMIVSKEIREYYTNEVVKEYFHDFEGKRIILPKYFMPSQKLLTIHRELLVE